MATADIKIKNMKLKEIFEKMNYEKAPHNIDLAREWFDKHKWSFDVGSDNKEESSNNSFQIATAYGKSLIVYQPKDIIVDKMLTSALQTKNQWSNIPSHKRMNVLIKLSDAIKKNLELFCQIEMSARGVLKKHTTRNVLYLAEYLEYYSSYAVRVEHENSAWKPNGLAVFIITEENPLMTLGLNLGPALAAGYNIILQTGVNITPSTTLLIELATKSGIPEETIHLFPGESINLQNLLTHQSVSLVSVFGNLYEEKFNICNPRLIQLMTFSCAKIPMIVFSSADIDSACDFVVDIAWSTNALDLFSVNTVLVQENILREFTDKLKQRVDKLIIGLGTEKSVDISESVYRTGFKNKVRQAIKEAELQGIETYVHQQSFLTPVFIGGKIHPNNVIKEDNDAPGLTLLAFRTITEAISLANNCRQGFGVSVWTQNISEANETVKKLKAGNVWINCSEHFYTPYITISPFKDSGNFYVGGEAGFYQFVNSVKLLDKKLANVTLGTNKKDKLIGAVSAANKAQVIWNGLSNIDRVKRLKKFAENIETRIVVAGDGVLKEWLNEWHKMICLFSTKLNTGGSNVYKCYNINSYTEPCGVIVIECGHEISTHNKLLIFATLLVGNSVIILNHSEQASEIYNEFTKMLTVSGVPSGVFAVISDFNVDVIKTVTVHKEINLYISDRFRPEFSSIPLKDCKKFAQTPGNKWEEILSIVAKHKNVWSDINSSIA